jgi:hypothetical protein
MELVTLHEQPLCAYPHPMIWSTVLSDLTADLHAIFRVRERKGGVAMHLSEPRNASKGNSASLSQDSVSISELTVLDDGTVKYRLAPGCPSRIIPADLAKSHEAAESWTGSQATERVYEYSLPPAKFARLKELLDRQEVTHAMGSFMNAGPGVGDFEIEISRSDATQRIPILSFMPQHYELREHPAITYVICEAKTIEQAQS